jgi:hypothetical protein
MKRPVYRREVWRKMCILLSSIWYKYYRRIIEHISRNEAVGTESGSISV